jgi:predicted ABC-type ATPase
MKPDLVLLAGPNGAGKTTFYEVHLRASGLPFLNVDVVVRDLGISDYEASQALDEIRELYIERKISFISETVFSDPVGAKVAMLRRAIDAGFNVRLIYIGLDSSTLAEARVSHRVVNGGHPVPLDKISARYPRSLANLALAVEFVSSAELLDNSDVQDPHRRIAHFEVGILKWKTDRTVPAGLGHFWNTSASPASKKL